MKRKARRKDARSKPTGIRQLLPLPSTQGVAEFADWLEVSAWTQSDQKISRQEVTSLFVFESTNEEAEEKVNKIWDELKTREFFLKEKYPFSFSGGEEVFCFNNENSYITAYVFCLLLSYFGLPKLMSKNTSSGSFLFEKLCTYVANKFVTDGIGSETKNMQFGHPRKEWERSKQPFKKAISELIEQIGDGTNRIDGVRNVARPGANTGDGGLDVVAWRSLPDEKRGLLILLGQCATAKDHNEYIAKINDLMNFLKEDVLFDFSYVLGLFVPHVLSHNDEIHRLNWEKIKRHQNIPFDRMRIILYGNDWQNEEVGTLIGKWKGQIKKENALA